MLNKVLTIHQYLFPSCRTTSNNNFYALLLFTIVVSEIIFN